MLGAKIGRGAVIFSPTVPACADMLTIGAGTVIRKDAVISGYRAVDGVIQVGPVALGRDVVVGEMTVLDIATSMGDGAQLGHSSSLHSGQSVPAGAHWHGSPAEPTTVDYCTVRSTRLSFFRRFLLPLLQLLFMLAVTLPLALAVPVLVFRQVPQLAALISPAPAAIATWGFYRDALLVSTVLFFGLLLLRLLVMTTVPRLLRVLVKPDREYKLYGIHYWAHRRIGRMTNSRYFVQLFGDSSLIVGYLRSIGYKLGKVVQTGSNFGSAVQHDNPFLSQVGTRHGGGRRAVVHQRRLLGQPLPRLAGRGRGAQLPRQPGRLPRAGPHGGQLPARHQGHGADGGPVREGVGLLGSPSFEIPRTVERDHQLDVTDPAEVRRLLRRKNRHNVLTILMFLLSRWILTSATTVLTLMAVDLHSELGLLVSLVGSVVLVLSTGYLILIDRLVRRMMVHRPDGCSIYDRAFWRHERFWKLGADRFPQLFNGTPMKNVVWRMLGAKIGKRVFDDGCTFTERRFVTIGDRCTLNAGSIVQCHSQEDGAFKSDRSSLGAGTTLGVGAFVHYGVQIGEGVRLQADSFLMKGSEVPSGSRWGGNPAMELEAPGRQSAPRPTPRIAHRTRSGRLPVAGRSCGLKEKACRTPQPTTASTGRACSPQAAPPPSRAGSPTRPPGSASTWRRSRPSCRRPSTARAAPAPPTPPCWPRCPVRPTWSPATCPQARNGRCRARCPPGPPRGASCWTARATPNASCSPTPTSRWRRRAPKPCSAAPTCPPTPSLGVSATDDATLCVRYRRDALDAEAAARIAGYHLDRVAPHRHRARRRVRRHCLLSAEEVAFQLDGLAGPHRELPDLRFHELFEQRVRTHPDAVAAECAGRRWTYRELNARANRIGHALLARGLGREGVVAVTTERNLDWMASVLAIFKAGGVYLPVEPHLPADRIAGVLRRAECRVRAHRAGQHGHPRPGAAGDAAGAAAARRRTPTRRTTRTPTSASRSGPTSSPTSTSPPAPPASPRAPCASTPGCSTTSRPRSPTWRSARARPSPRPPRRASTSRSGS